MRQSDVLVRAAELREELRYRIHSYWERNGSRRHWWQLRRDPLPLADELLLARAEWILAFLTGAPPEPPPNDKIKKGMC